MPTYVLTVCTSFNKQKIPHVYFHLSLGIPKILSVNRDVGYIVYINIVLNIILYVHKLFGTLYAFYMKS